MRTCCKTLSAGDLGEDGPRGLPAALEEQGPVEELHGATDGISVESEHPEGEEEDAHPPEDEVQEGSLLLAPSWSIHKGARMMGKSLTANPATSPPPRQGRGRRRNRHRRDRRHDYVVGVVVGRVQRVGEDGPREEHRRAALRPRTSVPRRAWR